MLRLSSRRLSASFLHHLTGRSFRRYASSNVHRPATIEPPLEAFTETALDRRRTPLGTMSRNQLESTLSAVNAWCQHGGLDSADSLVHRLGLELASGSLAARDYKDKVVETHLQLIEAYIAEHQGDQNNTLEDAERLLQRLALWYNRGSVSDVPAGAVANLVDAWLADGNDERASALLIWWTKVFPVDEESLIPIFKRVIDSSFDSDNDAVMIKLTLKLQALGKENGWASLDDIMYGKIPVAAQDDKSVSSPNEPDVKVDDSRSSGMNILKMKMIGFLKDASKSDIAKVNQYQTKLVRLPEFELTQDICESLLDFYIRAEFPKEAAVWLQHLDRAGSTTVFDKVLDVLKLFADNKDERSHWRANELFKRMEELEGQGQGIITTEMYNLYCKIWAQSGEAVAKAKVKEILTKYIVAANGGHADKTPNAQSLDLVFDFLLDSEEGARTALLFILAQWKSFEGGVLQDKVGVFLPKLVNFGLIGEAERLLRLAKSSNCSFDDDTLSSYVSAHTTSSNPMSVFAALDVVKELEGRVPFVCCANVILGFLNVKVPAAAQRERALLESVLKGAYDGTLSAPTDQVRHFIEFVIFILTKQGRYTEAEKILLLFESKQGGTARTDLLTPACFNNVMNGWLVGRKVDKVGSTFERLFQYGESDDSHLAPNLKSFSLYLKGLSNTPRSADRAEEILQTMLTRYSQTSDPDLKPDDGHFNSVLISLRNDAPPDVVDRSMALLQEMKALGVISESFTFDIIMKSILGSQVDNKFAKVMEVQKMLEEAQITPSAFTHNIILTACSCANKSETESALHTAIQSMQRLREFEERPNAVDYAAYVKVLRRLLKKRSKENIQIVAEAIQSCREDGVLNEKLVNDFRTLLGAK
ncbi:hypothetical protein MHU86_512 [Fragilaria crotonensis]|nr:hypothetical protein MHU86_512 [Fragilaria crotonensis]